MNQQSIETFLTIVQQKSISAAAKALYISQPAISTQLRRLEKELGVPLVIRTKGVREITLTPAGVQFLSIAQQFGKVLEKVESFKQLHSAPTLSIGAIMSMYEHVLPLLYQKLHREVPDFHANLHLIHSTEAAARVRQGDIDVAIVYGIYPDSEGLSLYSVFDEDNYVLCPADSQLPEGMITADQLNPRFEIFVSTFSAKTKAWHANCFPPDVMPRAIVDKVPHVVIYFNDPRCWALAHASVAMSLIQKNPGLYSYRILKPAPPRSTCHVLTRNFSKDTAVVQKLICALREFAEQTPYCYPIDPDTPNNEYC